MKRATREAILRTAITTHFARFEGTVIAQVDELIDRICEAEEEQEQRESREGGTMAMSMVGAGAGREDGPSYTDNS